MTSSSTTITAIIPAAGRPTNQINVLSNCPDTMLPINGKPVIGHILDDLLSRSITRAVIVISTEDQYTERYILNTYGNKMSLRVVRNNLYGKGLGYSIHLANAEIANDQELTSQHTLVYLGDTIYKGQLDFTNDFLIVNPNLKDSKHWCYVESTPGGLRYFNKPATYSGGQALAGIYFFYDAVKLQQVTNDLVTTEPRIDMHQILQGYDINFLLQKAESHYDCGNIENYYRARIDFLRTRSFNTISYDTTLGTITKSGSNLQKLKDEINWYQNIPYPLQIFSPRLIDYEITNKKVAYTIEYYGYQSLADYFSLNQFDVNVWLTLINKTFDILSLFKEETSELPHFAFSDMYVEKTLNRVDTLRKDREWEQLLLAPTIKINGETYTGLPFYIENLPQATEYLYKNSQISFIHGDPCLSNILFDPYTQLIKLIDPRGRFGIQSIYGDHHYDIAKLRHSFVSKYDFIVSDMFILEESNCDCHFQILSEPTHDIIGTTFDSILQARGYNLRQISLIEGLLFLSMIPLHNDNIKRQKAMFITGIKILNEVYANRN